MNKKDRIKDFIVFVLCDFSELLNEVTCFFEQKNKPIDEPFSIKSNIIKDYRDFLNEHLLPLPDGLPKRNDNNIVAKPQDLFDKEEKAILLEYLNLNYRHGYPDDVDFEGRAYGGNLELELKKEDLNNYIDYYFRMYETNNKVFVSYFTQTLRDFDLAGYEFEKEAYHIKKCGVQYENLVPELQEKFKEFKKEHYTKKLYECIDKEVFQTDIVIEDFELLHYYLDFDKTLENQIRILPDNFNDYNLDYSYDLKLTISYTLIKYINYIFYGIEPVQNERTVIIIKKAQEELDFIKKKNSKLVSFLNNKGFDEREINIIFNLMHLDKFSILNVPYFKAIKQVSQFHLLYSFHIFDYFNEDLNTIKDFKNVISSLTPFKQKSAEQFRKYFLNIKSKETHKHYPFKTYHDTLNSIKQKLKINREKLKQIPETPH